MVVVTSHLLGDQTLEHLHNTFDQGKFCTSVLFRIIW